MPAKPPPLNGAVDLAAMRAAKETPQPVTIVMDGPDGAKFMFTAVAVHVATDQFQAQMHLLVTDAVTKAVEAVLKKYGVVADAAPTA